MSKVDDAVLHFGHDGAHATKPGIAEKQAARPAVIWRLEQHTTYLARLEKFGPHNEGHIGHRGRASCKSWQSNGLTVENEGILIAIVHDFVGDLSIYTSRNLVFPFILEDAHITAQIHDEAVLNGQCAQPGLPGEFHLLAHLNQAQAIQIL
jgi:hypothetical protein